MSAPAWFDAKAYRTNKLDQLHDEGYTQYDPLTLAAAFQNAGYTNDEDGLYRHFVEYGKDENVSPNAYFDADYYFQAKAFDYFKDQAGLKVISQVSQEQVNFIKTAFAKAGLSAWDHYLKFGMREGIDPNANFNTSAYMEAKLALLQESDPTYTADQMYAAFESVGFNPIMHYMTYGADEGITLQPASHGYVLQELTSGIDNLTGTLGDPEVDDSGNLTISDNFDDYFNSEVGTLQSADSIDGYAGNDTFYARLQGDAKNGGSADSSDAVEPTIANVETVLFRAEVPSTGSQGYIRDADTTVGSYVDADRIYLADGKILTIGSDNSRADLSIEDIRHDSSETVIRMADTDPQVDFWVYFDPQHLKPENADTTGTLQLELQDVKNAELNSQPLTEQPFDKFTFSYSGSDDLITLQFRAEDAALYTGTSATYDTLLIAFQHALADFEEENRDLEDVFTITKEGSYPSRALVGSTEYKSDMGEYIVIRSRDGDLNATDAGTGWGVSTGVVPSVGRIVWGVHEASSTTCPLIEVTVELDNTGRVQWDDASDCLPDDIIFGSNAGDLQIGSMALRGGIERMDVKVDQGSWLAGLYSTNDTLRMVTVEGRDINGDDIIGNDSDTAGQLYIGTWEGKLDQKGNVDTDNLTWADAAKLLTADTDNMSGLKDVAVFDANAYGTYAGQINIAAEITTDSYDKYFKFVDGEQYINKMFAPLSGESYNGTFTYNTGSADDVVNMKVEGDIAADVDFKMNISTGAGDDLVAFRYSDMSLNQSYNQKYLHNVQINTEDGNDTIWFYADETPAELNEGDGSVIITSGAGKDTIYANQIDFTRDGSDVGLGDLAGPDNYNAVFVFNAGAKSADDGVIGRSISIADYEGATLDNDIVSGIEKLTFNKDLAASDARSLWVTVEYKGFIEDAQVSSYAYTAATSSTTAYVTPKDVTAEAINHAIIDAVNENDVLKELIVAKDGAGHSLLVEALTNGKVELSELAIDFQLRDTNGKTLDYTADSIFSTDVEWYSTQYAIDEYDSAEEFTGERADGVKATSQVQIMSDAGDDIIVLGDNGLKDTITLTSNFGHDKIFDFEIGTDRINISNIGYNTNDYTADLADLVSGSVSFYSGNGYASGVFGIGHINDLIDDDVIKFNDDAKSGVKALVFLHDTNTQGQMDQDVLTVAEITNGSTPTASILGYMTFDSTTDINAVDFVGLLANSGVLVGDPVLEVTA